MKVLLVEDEKKLAAALARGLKLKGFAADVVHDGEKALNRISLNRTDYDIVILDLMLPSMDGLEICRKVREWNITIPILVLTARSEIERKVELLQAGVDDYIVKPFSFDELIARIQALLRRPVSALPGIIEVGDIELNPVERRVTCRGSEIALTLKEFGLLEYFMRRPNQVIPRDDLLTNLWDFNYASFSNVVDVHVKNLRKKLDEGGAQGALETVRGVGYRLRG